MTGLLMKYFVLKPKGKDIYAAASRQAMEAYAQLLYITNTNPELAKELTEWAERENVEALKVE
jgi:hypothetical protein